MTDRPPFGAVDLFLGPSVMDGRPMHQDFHFISGLPRSGSTLLCAVLRQNPLFRAEMTSPMASIALSLIEQMSPPGQFAPFFDDDRRVSMLRGLFNAYYEPASTHAAVFDTNRIWTGNLALLSTVFPACRIICCVREIGWIIDSVERMLRRNPLQTSRIFEGRQLGTIYARVDALMNADIGFIGAAWGNLREAWYSEFSHRLLLFSYEGFVRDPAGAMRELYAALDQPAFAHDFEHLAYDQAAYDQALGMPGLHRVEPRITVPARLPAIPPDIFNKYAANAFWRTKPDRPNGPTIIC